MHMKFRSRGGSRADTANFTHENSSLFHFFLCATAESVSSSFPSVHANAYLLAYSTASLWEAIYSAVTFPKVCKPFRGEKKFMRLQKGPLRRCVAHTTTQRNGLPSLVLSHLEKVSRFWRRSRCRRKCRRKEQKLPPTKKIL